MTPHARPQTPLPDARSADENLITNAVAQTALDLEVGTSTRTALACGRTLTVSGRDGLDHVDIVDPSGRVELSIRVTPEGPVLEIDVLSLRLKARDISLECETLTTRASRSVTVACGGDVVETAEGKRHLESGGGTRIAGRDVGIVAEAGEASVRASDDVSIHGTTVLINC